MTCPQTLLRFLSNLHTPFSPLAAKGPLSYKKGSHAKLLPFILLTFLLTWPHIQISERREYGTQKITRNPMVKGFMLELSVAQKRGYRNYFKT